MSIHLQDLSEVDSLAIWGLGTMGRTWVLAALFGGFRVYAYEPDQKTREGAISYILKELEKAETKKGPAGLKEKAMSRLILVQTEEEAINSRTPIHLEVIPENLDLKINFFREIGPKLPENTILWSNTSCLDVEKLGQASGRPGWFVGTHGMNPVHMMPGVEVVYTSLVLHDVFDRTINILEKMGKIPFPAKNVPGFIVNKLYVPLALETIRLFFRGEADVATIDQALKLSLGHPQGGLLLADRIGHDVMIDVANELYAATQDPRYKVPCQYREMREAGNLGAKSGRGFYDWSDPKNPVPISYE